MGPGGQVLYQTKSPKGEFWLHLAEELWGWYRSLLRAVQISARQLEDWHLHTIPSLVKGHLWVGGGVDSHTHRQNGLQQAASGLLTRRSRCWLLGVKAHWRPESMTILKEWEGHWQYCYSGLSYEDICCFLSKKKKKNVGDPQIGSVWVIGVIEDSVLYSLP